MFVVVSYDVKDNRRRNRVLKVLKNFGQHIQYSVFECELKKEDFLRLKRKLERLINKEEDSIRYYFLCEKDVARIERYGGVQPLPKDVLIV